MLYRAELGTAKMEAEQARGHVEQYKSIAQAHEQALAELNATYDEYKRSMEATATQKEVSFKDLLFHDIDPLMTFCVS